ncbi:hypothetical protein [Haliangium sp.]|uniref:hypothetical protein n=1 Tax=Haliangium sp. TaxID=2663208 RepID=UPI003D15271F
MPEPSFRDTLRRRVLPVAFLAALALLGARTCAGEMAEVELVLDLGPAAADVRGLRLDLFPAGEDRGVLSYTRRFGAGGAEPTLSMRAELDPGDYRLRIEVETEAGTRTLERTAVVGDTMGARTTITVALGQALSVAAADPGGG